jgi:hypothetical protein
MECCDGKEFDPSVTAFTPQQWDVQALMDAYNDVKSAVSVIGQCSSSQGNVNVGAELAFFKKCCDGEITDLEKYQGSVSVNLGSLTCDAPVFGVPYVASANATANMGMNVGFQVSGQQTCEDTDVCFTGNAVFNVGGGVSGTAAGGAIRISLTLQSTNSAQAEYCAISGMNATVCLDKIDVVGAAEFPLGLTKSISYNLYDGGC